MQQAEATGLGTAAPPATDAGTRQEARRAEPAQNRATEEAELAKIAAAKEEAKRVKVQVAEVEPAPVPKKSTKPAKVTAIGFRGGDGNGQVEIAVGEDATVQIGDVTPTHAEIIVENAELAAKLERTLD